MVLHRPTHYFYLRGFLIIIPCIPVVRVSVQAGWHIKL